MFTPWNWIAKYALPQLLVWMKPYGLPQVVPPMRITCTNGVSPLMTDSLAEHVPGAVITKTRARFSVGSACPPDVAL